MKTLHQSPNDPGFIQNPYTFYAEARQAGAMHLWADYGMPAVFTHAGVSALLRDRRLGREIPSELRVTPPPHLAPFYKIEDHSLLEAEPPRHTRLRALVLRAFTSRAIAALADDITSLCNRLIDAFPTESFDLIPAYCEQVPVLTITRLLGVPANKAQDLLAWSHAMVAMYQANRSRATEDAAARAAAGFSAYLHDHIAHRRRHPGEDLITTLIAASESADRLSTDELIATCVLLLNAGHEATVASLGNSVACLMHTQADLTCLAPDTIAATVEELLRLDPPLHIFTRYVYEPADLLGHSFRRGDQVALLLGAANHDPAVWPEPARFDPTRKPKSHSAFGSGIHFCVGAPLARLEMQIALSVLFERCPHLHLTEPPLYADRYHFRGLASLMVSI